MEHPTVRRTVDLDCSPEALWRLVTEEELLATWLGHDVMLDVRPGGTGRLVDDDGRVRHLAVREVRLDERLSFAWWPDGAEDEASEVVLSVEPLDGGSRLVVTEAHDTGSSWDARLVALWLSVCALRARVNAGDPLDELFDALADPTRRRLFTRLVQDGPDTATRLSAGLPVTRQAVVKHLQALADAGLATPQRRGREVRYRANPEPLTTAVDWLVRAGAQWDERLARLEQVARTTRTLPDRDRR